MSVESSSTFKHLWGDEWREPPINKDKDKEKRKAVALVGGDFDDNGAEDGYFSSIIYFISHRLATAA